MVGRLRGELDIAALVARGIPAESAARLAAYGLGPEVIQSHVLPRRTLNRRQQDRTSLTKQESDRLVRLARLIAEAEDVLGGKEAGRAWLLRENRALNGPKPIALFRRLGSRASHPLDGSRSRRFDEPRRGLIISTTPEKWRSLSVTTTQECVEAGDDHVEGRARTPGVLPRLHQLRPT